MQRKFVLLALCAAGCCWAQQTELSPDLLLLTRIKTNMESTLRRQPNYTCVQQVERSQRLSPRQRFELVDMLRIEVALVDGKELFAWPGSKKFEDTELSRMVSGGAIGNGNFALHARAVFMSNGPVFTFRGADTVDGRRAVRFDFSVSLLNSGYHIRVNDREAIVAYHGSFWADPETADAIRLLVVADDLPPTLGLSRATDRMDYARIAIGGSDFLLPAASELTMIDLNRNENRNRTRFTSCRQYMGESVLSFAEPQPEETAAAPTAAESRPEELPGGLAADVRLATEIDSDKAMVGDPVEAVLEHPIKHKHQVLMPQGTTLAGRIVRFERRRDDSLLDIEFTEAKSVSSRWDLLARVEEIHVFSFGWGGDKSAVPRNSATPGAVTMKGGRIHLAKGVRMTLRTEDTVRGEADRPKAQEKQ
jgi:hypothetical protein